jgi:ribonuclease III
VLQKLYNYYISSDKDFAKRIKSMTGITPKKLNLYKLAFYHRSTFNELTELAQNNERLEYLGDALLNSISAEYLYQKYPNGNEGFLTKMRSKIVKRKTLNYIADAMGLDTLLMEFNRTHISTSMLGNALEALIGAMYLELGYDRTKKFVIKDLFRKYLDIHDLEQNDDNFKSKLLEWGQKHGHDIQFKVLSKFKQDHRDRYRVVVAVNGEDLSTAEDFNKKNAEQQASEVALGKLGIKEGAEI